MDWNQLCASFLSSKKVGVNNYSIYECKTCGYEVKMYLDCRFSSYSYKQQPTPFSLLCPHCKNLTLYHSIKDIGKDTKFNDRVIRDDESYFEYDTSGKENACGIPHIVYRGKGSKVKNGKINK